MKISFSYFRMDDYFYLFAIDENINITVGTLTARLNVGYNRFKDLCNGNKCAYIYSVKTTYTQYLGQGIATSLLNKLFDIYSEYNFYLCVIPSKRCEKDLDYEQLKNFYNKFGFFRTNELTPTMFRKSTKTFQNLNVI